jgi:hypothetical protein
LQLYTVPPNRAGDDFVAHSITLAHVQDLLLAQINRTAIRQKLRLAAFRCNMVEKNANNLRAALLDRNDGLQKYRGGARSNGVAFFCA